MTHPRHALAAGLTLALVPAAVAAKPPKGSTPLSLDAKPTTIVYSKTTTLSGRLTGKSQGGVRVLLEVDTTRPYGDAYRATGTATTTEKNGDYRFVVKPRRNTQYRAVAQASPPQTSNPKLVLVRTLVGSRVSDSTPRPGARVRFFGLVYPAHDGRAVLVQRRSTSGSWVTVRRTSLRDAGTASSTYSTRVRIRRDGEYRVKVPGDADHVNGFSRTQTIRFG